jgi:hypothetical protein
LIDLTPLSFLRKPHSLYPPLLSRRGGRESWKGFALPGYPGFMSLFLLGVGCSLFALVLLGFPDVLSAFTAHDLGLLLNGLSL